MGDWSGLTGILSGFSGRKAEIEQQTLEESRASSAREQKVFEALVNSPDPEIQSLAVAGLLQSAEPRKRKGGLAGWMGELQGSPHLPKIQALLSQPVQTEEPVLGLPSTQTSGYISEPPGQTPLAQPETSPTEVGAPPPRPVETNLQTQSLAPPVVGMKTVSKPRQVFETPEQATLKTKKAAAQGDVEGQVAGLVASGVPEAQARETVRRKMLGAAGRAGTLQSVSGEAPDATGRMVPAFGVFDRATGAYTHPTTGEIIAGFRPRVAGQRGYGQDREALALETYGKKFADLEPAEVADVMAKAQALIRTTATNRAEGTNAAIMTKPIGVSEAQRTNTAVGTTPAQYAGQEIASTQEQDRRRSVETVRTQLDHISTLLGALPKSTDLAGLAPGAALAIRRRAPGTRAQIAQLESAVDNIIATLSRTVQENRGAQTENDATRAYNTVVALKGRLLDPLAGDTQESAAARIAETKAALDQVLSRLPGTPSPRPPAGSAGGPPPGVGAAPPAPAGGSPTMPSAYKGPDGVWRIRQPAAGPQPLPQ